MSHHHSHLHPLGPTVSIAVGVYLLASLAGEAALSQMKGISDPVLLAIIGGVVTITTTVFGGIMTYLMYKIQRQGEKAVVAANVVAVKLEDTNKIVDTKLGAIHTLVNSQYGTALATIASDKRRIADKSGDPVDILAAEEAEQRLAEHIAKQAVVDKKAGHETTGS
jgi:hypothetical protein